MSADHVVAFKSGGIDVRFSAQACGEGATTLHITAGLATVCIAIGADTMRNIAHAQTMAADEAQMAAAIPAGEATESDFGAFEDAAR